MAGIKEVASFDVQTDQAVQSINRYIARLKELEKQRAQNIRLGKSTVAVNKEIDQTIDAINDSLSQQTQTTKGLVAQQQALRSVQKEISKDSQKRLQTLDKEEKTRKRITKSLRSQRRAFSDLRFIAIGAAAGIVGALSQVGEGIDAVNNLLFPQIGLQNKVADATKNAAVEYVKEKAELDNLFETTQSDTASREEKLAAIDAINKEYGNYLPNLITEQTSLADLKAAQDAATEAILRGIVARQKVAIAEQLLQQVIDGTITRLNNSATANSGFLQTLEDVGAFGQITGLFVDASEAVTDVQNSVEDLKVKSAQEQLQLLAKTSDETLVNFLKNFDGLADIFGDISAEAEQSTTKTAKATKDLTGTLAGLQKQLSDAQKVLKEGIQITDEDALAAQQDQINTLQNRIKELQDFLKTVGEEPIQLTDIDLFVPDLDATFGLDQGKVEESLQKGLDQLEITGLRAQIEQVEIRGLLDVEALEDARNEALKVFRGTAAERDALNEAFNERRLQREQQTARQILQLQLQILQAEREIAAQAGENLTAFDKQIAETQLKLTELDQQQVNVEIDADTEAANAKIAKIQETIGFVTDGLEQLGGGIINFFQQQTDAALTKLEGDVARQQQFLDSLLSNTEEANAQQVQAERDRLDNLVKERQKAVERQQALAQLEVALNAAIAIARAAAEGGAGAAITIAATLISLAIGFAQARATASQAFAGGTDYVSRGKGEPSGTDTVHAMLDEGEAVIQTDMNRRYSSTVKAIRRGNIDPKLMHDFVTNPQKYKDFAAAAASGLLTPSLQRQMAASGVTLNMGSGGMSRQDVQALLSEMKQTRELIGNIPVNEWKVKGNQFAKVVMSVQDRKQRDNKRFR